MRGVHFDGELKMKKHPPSSSASSKGRKSILFFHHAISPQTTALETTNDATVATGDAVRSKPDAWLIAPTPSGEPAVGVLSPWSNCVHSQEDGAHNPMNVGQLSIGQTPSPSTEPCAKCALCAAMCHRNAFINNSLSSFSDLNPPLIRAWGSNRHTFSSSRSDHDGGGVTGYWVMSSYFLVAANHN